MLPELVLPGLPAAPEPEAVLGPDGFEVDDGRSSSSGGRVAIAGGGDGSGPSPPRVWRGIPCVSGRWPTPEPDAPGPAVDGPVDDEGGELCPLCEERCEGDDRPCRYGKCESGCGWRCESEGLEWGWGGWGD